MGGSNAATKTSTATPLGHDLQPSGRHGRDEIISNLVGHSLIEDAFIPK